VLIDEQARADHGINIDEQGNCTVSEQRLYQLIREQRPGVNREFEIGFLAPATEAFAFTFGFDSAMHNRVSSGISNDVAMWPSGSRKLSVPPSRARRRGDSRESPENNGQSIARAQHLARARCRRGIYGLSDFCKYSAVGDAWNQLGSIMPLRHTRPLWVTSAPR
jgi:hypothetical protein